MFVQQFRKALVGVVLISQVFLTAGCGSSGESVNEKTDGPAMIEVDMDAIVNKPLAEALTALGWPDKAKNRMNIVFYRQRNLAGSPPPEADNDPTQWTVMKACQRASASGPPLFPIVVNLLVVGTKDFLNNTTGENNSGSAGFSDNCYSENEGRKFSYRPE
ncbi:MAG: hypothetical protein ACRCSF_06510 [Mycobacteriaceae bacterium]